MIARFVDWFGRALTNRNTRSYGPHSESDTAVLVLCPQVDVFAENGALSQLCEVRPDVNELTEFLKVSRERGWLIIHSPLSWGEATENTSVGSTHYINEIRRAGILKAGEVGTELADQLCEESDIVLAERHGLNAFFNSKLLEVLRHNDRSRLIVVGGVVNADVDSSARSAVEYDLHTTVVGDLVSAFDRTSYTATLETTLPRIVHCVLNRNQVCQS
ncbi:isochorismatase family protein [uncultured Erythrobacter sp.]|uniref:cysteine hydrolase family protein n=1 Tax=uncultured Erythrobacter sp. TaxID=263913 RepID=UPI002634AA2E|nr:isochorismatase family protein [uncultured Erythrobacter sp.]